MSVRVRRLEERDKSHWLALFKGYIEFYQASVPENVIETVWHRLMLGKPDCHIGLVVVEDADAPLVWRVLFIRSTWATGWYCYLEDLFVDPARRKTGAGRALIEAVYALADARGCERTYWVTQEFNTAARTLYDQVATKAPFVQYRR